MKRLPYVILSLVVLCILSVPARPQVKNAVVASHLYDPATNTVTIHMFNNTDKDITAYNISIKEKYGQQVNEHQYSGDTVGVMLTIQDPTEEAADRENLRHMYHSTNGTWQAGTSHDEVIHVQSGLTDFEAVLDTVIFADKTAETTNKDALDRILAQRKSWAHDLEIENQAIQHALANAADQTPHETARKEIEGLEKSREATYHMEHSGGESGAILEMKNAPQVAAYFRQTVPEYLNNLIQRNTKRASLIREHATPTVVSSREVRND